MKNIFKITSILLICLLSALQNVSAQKVSENLESTALLIIDVQNDYFAGGKMELSGSDKAGKNVKQLLEYFRMHHLPIIHIQHIALQKDADFFLPNTLGAEINSLVKPKENEKVITKHYPNSFRETDLLEYLQSKGIKKLVITGMMTDVCVDATVRASMDFGFTNTVIGDAVATRDRDLYGQTVKAVDINTSYLAGMSALGGLYAKILTTKQFLNNNK
ncbi:nicotinamidase-related amidase [Chryseobacterium sp. H1D6B]|uniref:cysteine hydrolase family protein n=1 Tax=Chryseobacterium sp. H1D6B TaxID=2940588 RepID=UPI0015C9B125|nr:cysteine hydrolase family protein [Chryseobacterium sp. H1D6B]MDH6253661.1 nicotinamidase-related amidase [Chryseobacterium sp. H1D6B]